MASETLSSGEDDFWRDWTLIEADNRPESQLRCEIRQKSIIVFSPRQDFLGIRRQSNRAEATARAVGARGGALAGWCVERLLTVAAASCRISPPDRGLNPLVDITLCTFVTHSCDRLSTGPCPETPAWLVPLVN